MFVVQRIAEEKLNGDSSTCRRLSYQVHSISMDSFGVKVCINIVYIVQEIGNFFPLSMYVVKAVPYEGYDIYFF